MKKIFIAIISILLVCLGLAGLAHHLEKPAAGGKGPSGADRTEPEVGGLYCQALRQYRYQH